MIVSDAHNFASRLSRNMEEIQLERQMYIEKLSSGKKVEKSTDDAGALSNKIKQASELKRLRSVNSNLQNAKSYLEVREGALASVHKIYDRMAQLSTMAMDITKNDSDRENYEKEFQELRDTALKISREKFNGINLFRDKSYTLVNKNGAINWTDSKAEVDALNASDSQSDHYLATITSELEQAEIAFQIGEVGINAWLGGNDVTSEGDWRWTEGPEGEANGGIGTPFWSGNHTTGNLVNGMFENWGNNEPNNHPWKDPVNGEDYLQISQGSKPIGSWNDLPNVNGPTGGLQPTGYVRETDQGNLIVNDDVEGGGFEIGNALFQKFIFNSMISIDSLENAKKALGTLENILTGVSNARAIGGASLSRLEKEITANENLSMETEKSLSRIEDVDMAITASRLARAEIKMQSTTAIFAQANKLFNQRNYVDELLS
ncbi:flagellin [Opitutales bacterium]|nr:flagellin [Opitutales bacterium]